MFPGNSQYYTAQQLQQNAYLQQQLQQGYTSRQNSTLSPLQQHTPVRPTVGYTSSTQALNSLSLQAKQPQNSLHQSTSYLLKGSLPLHCLPEAHQQSSAQWQRLPEHQQAMQTDQVSHNIGASNQSNPLLSPHNLNQAMLRIQNLGQSAQNPHAQASSVTQALQQPQLSRIALQSMTQRQSSNLGINTAMNPLASNRISQEHRQPVNRSISVPKNNTSFQSGSRSDLFHSPPNLSSQDIAMTMLGKNPLLSMRQPGHVQMQPKSASSQSEKRDKIHIRFDQKSKQMPQANLSQQQRSKQSDSESSKDGDEPLIKKKQPLVLENNTRIVIDDDLEIVGTKEAEIMSHMRSDCPVHRYKFVDSVDLPPDESNVKYCSKCFCYVCDKPAKQCEKWKESSSPHCNGNSKSSCWRARRNVKKSPLMLQFKKEELTPELELAGEMATKYTIGIREAYITYRNGISCEFFLVPCDCSCHRAKKFPKDTCTQCKAVHDMKKRFNYEPVRKVVLDTIHTIVHEYGSKPYIALVLFEALLSELCSHRPADFNHVTRMPSNPDTKCQCNTPQIMDEFVDWELIKIFTHYEVQSSFKEKFIKCVTASIQPLQLKDILKRFLQMRHWDDVLLRSVLIGQCPTGRLKNGDMLKEAPLIIEMRVKKLFSEQKFQSLLYYLHAVKVAKAQKNSTSDGTPILTAIERWNLECFAKVGFFKEACVTLVNAIPTLPVSFVLNLFSLLSGKDLPQGTELLHSFNVTKPSTYEVTGKDLTVFLLVYLMFMDTNTNAQMDFTCYLWLVKWLNERKMEFNQNEVAHWMQSSFDVVDLSRKIFATPNFPQHLQQCQAITPQAALLTCSPLIIQYIKKSPANFSCLPQVIESYKNNEWALFYLFSQPILLSSGNHLLIKWMTNFMKTTGNTLSQFNGDAFRMLIRNNTFMDVCFFMQQWIAPTWVDQSLPFIEYFLDICALFAQKIMEEISKNHDVKATEWFGDAVMAKIIERNIQRDPSLLKYCELIGKVCCWINIKNVPLCARLYVDPATSRKNVADVLSYYLQKLSSNALKAEVIVELFHIAYVENYPPVLRQIFSHYIEKHECCEPGTSTSRIMDEVIKIVSSPQENQAMAKEELVLLYSRLFAHDTLSWLICVKCSATMPKKWMDIWHALSSNELMNALHNTVEQTLTQFSMWMKDLSALEENDIRRLLQCLNAFLINVTDTLMDCKFDMNKLHELIVNTANFMANLKLKQDYYGIIERVFEAIRKKQNPVSALPIQRIADVDRQPLIPIESRDSTSEHDQLIAAAENFEKNAAKEQAPVSSNTGTPGKHSESESHAKDESQKSPLKLTINKSRLSTSGEYAPTSFHSDKSLSSPLGSPGTCCPQCGDPMTNLFRCSKCHARKSVDVRCPNCSEMNNDLKGYSCKYCYASLLEVLTTGGEVKSPEPQATPKFEHEKKRKKLKRKKYESSVKSETAVKTVQPLSEQIQQTAKINAGNDSNDVAKQFRLKQAASKEGVDDAETDAKRPRIKTVLSKEDSFGMKSSSSSTSSSKASSSFPAKSHHRAVISKISVNDLIPQPPKPHQRAKEAQQKERSYPKSHHAPKQEQKSTLSKFKTATNLSDSDSDSDDSTPPQTQVPPLILRRKSDMEPAPERKVVPPEPAPSAPVKRPASQGISMSKKQKNILQRMKNVGRGGRIMKQPKTNPKTATESTEWEVQKRRKPGPKSKTSYYSVDQRWAIPRTDFDAR